MRFAAIFNPMFLRALVLDVALIAMSLYIAGHLSNLAGIDFMKYFVPVVLIYSALHAVAEILLPW